jgi:hypothetical protein
MEIAYRDLTFLLRASPFGCKVALFAWQCEAELAQLLMTGA